MMCRSCWEDEMQIDYSCLREILEYVETNSDGFITNCGLERNRDRNFQACRLRQGTINFTDGCSEAAQPPAGEPNRRFQPHSSVVESTGQGAPMHHQTLMWAAKRLLSTFWQGTSMPQDTTNASPGPQSASGAPKPVTHRHQS